MSFFSCLKNLFQKKDDGPLFQTNTDLNSAIGSCLNIVAKFEGGGYGNVVGNFDGAGLTCGILGFTWFYGVQQTLIKHFATSCPGQIQILMPEYGATYLQLAEMPATDSLPKVISWSQPIFDQLKKELQELWTSPDMVQIQLEACQGIGKSAYEDALRWAERCRLSSPPTLQEFLFFFDVHVQNGSLGIEIADACLNGSELLRAVNQVFDWCGSYGGVTKDIVKNGKHWRSMKGVETQQYRLLYLGYLRAKKAGPRFIESVMNRKGTIAMLGGYCNGAFVDLNWTWPNTYVKA